MCVLHNWEQNGPMSVSQPKLKQPLGEKNYIWGVSVYASVRGPIMHKL